MRKQISRTRVNTDFTTERSDGPVRACEPQVGTEGKMPAIVVGCTGSLSGGIIGRDMSRRRRILWIKGVELWLRDQRPVGQQNQDRENSQASIGKICSSLSLHLPGTQHEVPPTQAVFVY